MNKRQSVKIYMSVEGDNCERLYFKHIAKIINSSGRNEYDLKIEPKKMGPYAFAKRFGHLPKGGYRPKGKKKEQDLPFIHIQDIEDYYDQEQQKKFTTMIDEMRKVEREFHLTYQLGYSNYTFELWLLLHVVDFTSPVPNRTSYLNPINRYFSRDFVSLNEFKEESEFQKILDECITLDSVFQATERAKKLWNIIGNRGKSARSIRRLSFTMIIQTQPCMVLSNSFLRCAA